jgi:CRP-like cAMP-binding protein
MEPCRRLVRRLALAPQKGRVLSADRKNMRNKILAGLSAGDFALLQPDLEPVELPVRKLLEVRGRRVEHVYFFEKGLASMVVTGGSHHSLEVGMIGREGLTGLSLLMGTDRSPYEVFMQSPGSGWRISADAIGLAIGQSPNLRQVFLRHGHTLVVQMAFTALANGRYKIEERLARWLLMAHDRADGDTLTLTHEFLAVMLGVRRPGVTTTLNELAKRGMIVSHRGMVMVKDRAALEETANGGYGAPESEYERLFGLAL